MENAVVNGIMKWRGEDGMFRYSIRFFYISGIHVVVSEEYEKYASIGVSLHVITLKSFSLKW